MPWHSDTDHPTHGLSRRARALFENFDHTNDRRINAAERHAALVRQLGAPEATALLAAFSSKSEHDAVRKVFDAYDHGYTGQMDTSDLLSAVAMLGFRLPSSAERAQAMVNRYRGGMLELGEFRTLCSELRRQEKEGDLYSPISPAEAAVSCQRRSADDGGSLVAEGVDASVGARGKGGASLAYLTESALDLEVRARSPPMRPAFP